MNDDLHGVRAPSQVPFILLHQMFSQHPQDRAHAAQLSVQTQPVARGWLYCPVTTTSSVPESVRTAAPGAAVRSVPISLPCIAEHCHTHTALARCRHRQPAGRAGRLPQSHTLRTHPALGRNPRPLRDRRRASNRYTLSSSARQTGASHAHPTFAA